MIAAGAPLVSPDFDRINRRAYRKRGVLRQYEAASGWLEPGERRSIELVTPDVRGGAILDIGMGGGRTAPLLQSVSENYLGIDYTPAMVERARRRFPTLRFLEMDARKLELPDKSFDLALFSYNGIDSVNLTGRLQILCEVNRVLRPDGYFVFSTLNRQGRAYGERWPDFRVFSGAGLSPRGLARGLMRFLLGGANWFRYRLVAHREGDMAVDTISAHNFALVTVFTSIAAQLCQLRRCGFTVEAILEPDSHAIAPDGSEPTNAPWCYFVARKTAGFACRSG